MANLHVGLVPTSYDSIYPKTQGAINTYVSEMAKNLSQWDKITLFGRGNGGLNKGNLHIETFSYRLPSFISNFPQIKDLSYSSIYGANLLFSVNKIHQENPFDIIHINNIFETPVANFLKNSLKLKTVCSVHNTFKSPLIMATCDRILANSEYLKKFLIDAHLPKDRIEVLPIAVDTNMFKPMRTAKAELGLADRHVVLFVGRKIPYKGPKVLIDALPKVCRKYPKTTALLVGPDYYFGSQISSYSAILQKQIEKLNLQSNVVMTAFIPDGDLVKYMSAADVFVCPSIWQEPFGKVVLEANACETPVVASKVGGLPELIEDGVNGVLVEANEPESLATAIIRLLDNEERAKSMGRVGREIVKKKFSYEVVSSRCQKIYNSVLK